MNAYWTDHVDGLVKFALLTVTASDSREAAEKFNAHVEASRELSFYRDFDKQPVKIAPEHCHLIGEQVTVLWNGDL